MNNILKNEISENLIGEINVPGDKSISHRAIMIGSIANGKTTITNFLKSEDTLATIDCFKKLGIKIIEENNTITVYGKGLDGLKEPSGILDAKNSGTTTRLLSGILSGQNFKSTITGDESLKKRPMSRIITPLSKMGATFIPLSDDNHLPFTIIGGNIKGSQINSPIASAQVKSACLFAGLYGDCPTVFKAPAKSRNHTEIMLKAFGAGIKIDDNEIIIKQRPNLVGQNIIVPNDISSAAYFMVAGLITKGSNICIKNVNTNPTRAGIINVIQEMNGNISLHNPRKQCGEDVCDIYVSYSPNLKGIEIGGEIIPKLIDELPIIAILATQATGKTIIKDAYELRVKESNRIDVMVENLSNMGATIKPCDDGMVINGKTQLYGANIKTYNDHRVAMSFAIANLICKGSVILDNPSCVNISFPNFYEILDSLKK